MKKLIVLFSLVAFAVSGYGQGKDIVTVQDQNILKLPIPHYKILRADSTYVTEAAIKKNKPVMFIYFSPECPHCQRLLHEMEENYEPFKKIQIVMICYTRTVYPYLRMLKNFSRDFDLPGHKNITMGSEFPKTAIVNYFHVQTTPFVAVYDRNGKMVQYLNKLPKIEDVVAAIKKVSS
jgi:thioredoxin-related protein